MQNLDFKMRQLERQSLIGQQNGEAVEALGMTIQQQYQMVADYGHQIEEHGLLIQYHALQSLRYTLLRQQGLSSKDLLIKASQESLWASKLVAQAIKLYLEAIACSGKF